MKSRLLGAVRACLSFLSFNAASVKYFRVGDMQRHPRTNPRHKFSVKLLVAAFGLICVAEAGQATTINGLLSVDNAFIAYISTSDSTLGTQVATGHDYSAVFGVPATTLTPGVTNYLHIEAFNLAVDGNGPAMFVGQFSLSDTQFKFANGTQSLLTNTTDWSAGLNSTNNIFTQQPWVTPGSGGLISFATNAVGTGTWGPPRAGIDPTAQFIWSTESSADVRDSFVGCYVNGCTVDFSTPIIWNGPATVPLPATAWLFGSGLLGLLGIARRKKA
jgi:hypothetical protein